MAVQSKERDDLETLEKKKANAFLLYLAGFMQLSSLILLIQATPMMVINHYKGDGVKAVHLLNRLNSVAAIIEFILNPILGNLSDSKGRKLFLCAAPLATLLLRFKVAQDPSIRNVLLGTLVNAILVPAFFTSLTASAGDMFQGNNEMLADMQGKIQVTQGLSLVVGPLLGGYLASRDHRYPYLLSSILGGVSLLLISTFFKETLQEKDKKKFEVSGINPFSFMKLFTGSSIMARLNLIYALQTFPMFMGNVSSVFAKEQRKWGPNEMGRFQSCVGIAGILAGTITKPSIKNFGLSHHSIFATGFAVLSYIVWGAANTSERAYLGLALNCIGQMRRSAVIARITTIASESGLGQGELSSNRANLVAVVKAIAPLIFASLFSRGRNSGQPGLAHFGAAGLLGAAELILLTLGAKAWGGR